MARAQAHTKRYRTTEPCGDISVGQDPITGGWFWSGLGARDDGKSYGPFRTSTEAVQNANHFKTQVKR